MPKIDSEIIYKRGDAQCLLLTMEKDEYLKPHKAMADILIIIKQGHSEIEHDGKTNRLRDGEYISLKPGVVHAVKAVSKLQFYLFKLAPHD